MSIETRMAGSVDRLARHFGGQTQVTLRRQLGLSDPSTSGPPTLAVDGTTALGSGTITLDASGMRGWMYAGVKFTIAGDATVYTVSTDLEAASNALTGLAFTPVLAAEAADDAVVTLTQEYGETTMYGSVKAVFNRDINDGSIQEGDRMVLCSTVGVSIPDQAFKNLDDFTLVVDGVVNAIKNVKRHRPGFTDSGLVFHLGASH